MLLAEDLPGEHPSLNLVGALVNFSDLAVPKDCFHRSLTVVGAELANEPQPTECLNSVARDAGREIGPLSFAMAASGSGKPAPASSRSAAFR